MNFSRLYHTVKHLRFIQLRYQLQYRLIKPGRLSRYNSRYLPQQVTPLNFSDQHPQKDSFLGHNTFSFLNQSMTFGAAVDWNYQGFGKLWNYHLQYGTFLGQSNLLQAQKLDLILSLYTSLKEGTLALEPYPVSLRVMNVIPWLSQIADPDPHVLEALHAELDFLSGRLEYHLLGNHLLENGFALLMGGAFFSHKAWLNKASSLLSKQLNEQILLDGAHFELSPSYHNIILFRLLEAIDWMGARNLEGDPLWLFLKEKARKMLSWMGQMCFKNGEMPHFNDSSSDMALSSSWLLNYAAKLNIPSARVPLGASGYRAITMGGYECRADVAPLGPSYQPGHAHADALSFVLYHNNQPLLVERGTSTYQPGPIRAAERSTAAHNTVVVGEKSQSQMWSQFRVAQRARTSILVDTPCRLTARHNGYKALGITHQRDFKFLEKEIIITDELWGHRERVGEMHLHFHPHCRVSLRDNTVKLNNHTLLSFSELEYIKMEAFEMAVEFNKYSTSQKVVVGFKNKLKTKISFPS